MLAMEILKGIYKDVIKEKKVIVKKEGEGLRPKIEMIIELDLSKIRHLNVYVPSWIEMPIFNKNEEYKKCMLFNKSIYDKNISCKKCINGLLDIMEFKMYDKFNPDSDILISPCLNFKLEKNDLHIVYRVEGFLESDKNNYIKEIDFFFELSYNLEEIIWKNIYDAFKLHKYKLFHLT